MKAVTQLLNLCPHDIVIRGVDCVSDKKTIEGKSVISHVDDAVITLTPCDPGKGARCTEVVKKNEIHTKNLGFRVNDVPEYDNVTGIPTDCDDGSTGIIVSMLVGQHIAKHPELWKGPVYGPDSGSTAIRDEKNQIKAVTGLILYKE